MVFYSYETKVILLQVPTFQTAQTLHSYVLKSCSCESYLYCREEKTLWFLAYIVEMAL
jgi:hypothetical protein